MTEINPSARVQRRSVGELQHPACCACCGNGTSLKGYVDPAIWYEWEGQVYFCWNCTKEMGAAIGMLDPDESEFLINQNKEMAAELAALKEKQANADRILDVFNHAVAAAVDSGSLSISSVPTEPESGEPANESDVSGAEPEPIASKSVKKRRPNDAPRLTGGDGSSTITL